MNLSISKNALYNALNTVSHAVSPNSPQPVLRGIKITADETGLILIGSDADISIMKKIKADEENKMNIVDTGSLLQVIQGWREDKVIVHLCVSESSYL